MVNQAVMVATPTSTTDRTRLRGFTLLELLVVLVVAALAVATVGVRGQAWMQHATYHQAVRDITALLRAARLTALQEGRDVSVYYDPQAAVLFFGQSPRQRVELPAGLDIRVDGQVAALTGAQAPPGQPVFVFLSDASAHGGRLMVKRGATGIVFAPNWALGTVEQTPLVAPPS